MLVDVVGISAGFFHCLNLLVQSMISIDTKCIVSINAPPITSVPIIQFNFENVTTEIQSDLRPNIYIINLDVISITNILEIIRADKNFNPEAQFILFGSKHHYSLEEFHSRLINNLIFLNSSEEVTSPCEHEVLSNTIENSSSTKIRQQVQRLALKVCYGIRLPYFICVAKNCSSAKGIIIEISDMIQDHLNIDFEYFGFEPVAFYAESGNYLLSGECDLVLDEIYMKGGMFDLVYQMNDDSDIWIIKKPGKIPQWKYLISVFSFQIWTVWFVCTLIACLAWATIEFSTESSSYGNIFIKIFIKFLKKIVIVMNLFLEQESAMKVLRFYELLLFIPIIHCIFTMSTIYKGRYTYMLLGANRYINEIRNFDDILEHKMYLLYYKPRQYRVELLNPKIKEYPESLIIPHNIDPIKWLDRVAFNENTASMKSTMETKYSLHRYKDEYGNNLLQLLKPAVNKIVVGMIF
ncbi:hypothetical protein HHI36_016746 [Cryptolaemus montrouzieri]|uniref:Ionotropic receptor n=1 Tax=Cryptolaemus montrouzieri TaxID=559131 RepID=A0ABD2NKL6_9CUCU